MVPEKCVTRVATIIIPSLRMRIGNLPLFVPGEMANQVPSGNDDNGDKKPPRETKKTTGYECEFVERPPKHFQSKCPICLQILREPYIVDCCGYSFCAACIERVGKDGKPCPRCNQSDYTTLVNKGLKRPLNEFRVYCSHRHHGCGWVGELGKLDEHLNFDPQPQRQMEGCPISVIECLHCKEGIRRDKIADHQLKRCPQRLYTCKYCVEYKSTFEDVAHSHWPECKSFLLPCPNNCTPSGLGIQRQHLAKHVKEECPMMVVQCELHHAGCEVSLSRKDMADHMKENLVTHLSLLAAENHHLSKRLLKKEEQIVVLTQAKQELAQMVTSPSREFTQKVTCQDQELTRTKQELTETKQRLTQTEQELRQKVTSLSRELTRVTQELNSQSQELSQTKQEQTQWVTYQLLELTLTKQEFMRKVATLSQELTQTKQELTQKVATQSQELTRTKQELNQIATSHEQMMEAKLKEAQRQAIDQLLTQQQHDLRELRTEVEMRRDIPPVTLEMAAFDMFKKKSTTWFSRPFYTGMAGYKMCLSVDANGSGAFKGTHVSVHTCLICGEFDSQLKWPIRGNIIIQLVNQLEDKEHLTYSIYYTDAFDANAVRVTDGERSGGLGRPRFLPHSDLGLSADNNRQYLKDDCLVFRIVSVKIN